MVAQIDAINHGVVFSLPNTARSRVVIYSPASIMIPITAIMRFGLDFIDLLPFELINRYKEYR